MQKSIFILLAILSTFLAACAPQVTVTPQATVTLTPPPTATVLPTPTLHPQFIVLQDQIAAAGERFTLKPDGTVQDGATNIPGLQVGNDGKITITVNGEPVEIDPSSMNFDDENGLSIEGFEDSDGEGDWEAARPIKEFPWCKDMRLFEQCVIDVADLQEHGRFAQSTLTEDLFDPTQLKIMTEYSTLNGIYKGVYEKLLVPNVETAPNYKNEKTAPFKKDYMFGITTINGVDQYVIQVPYYIEGVEANDFPVITGVFRARDGGYKDWDITIFLDRMNVVPWNISDLSLATEYINPKTGVNFTLEEVRAIVKEMKVGNFANTNGLVLKFDIARVTGGWYE